MVPLHLLSFICVLGLAIRPCASLSSKSCIELLNTWRQRLQLQTDAEPACPTAVCGALDVPEGCPTFLERLSPQCKSLMESYRQEGKQFGWANTTGAAITRRDLCASEQWHASPNNPVVVQVDGVGRFVMCSVPLAGSSSFRKLLNVVIRGSELEANDEQQDNDAHFAPFPTLWHYKLQGLPADRYPSFIVARNPYERLLSAYLRRMAVQVATSDVLVSWAINRLFRLPTATRWDATAKDFHHFVKHLQVRGVHLAGPHFTTQLAACGPAVSYEYLLRLEDLATWLPCVEDGLGITQFTSNGWIDVPEGGSMWVGHQAAYRDHLKGRHSCWWHPPGTSCKEYYERTRPGWRNRGKVLQSADVKAVPFVSSASEEATSNEHWRVFYTQEVADVVHELYRRDFEAFGYERAVFAAAEPEPCSEDARSEH